MNEQCFVTVDRGADSEVVPFRCDTHASLLDRAVKVAAVHGGKATIVSREGEQPRSITKKERGDR